MGLFSQEEVTKVANVETTKKDDFPVSVDLMDGCTLTVRFSRTETIGTFEMKVNKVLNYLTATDPKKDVMVPVVKTVPKVKALPKVNTVKKAQVAKIKKDFDSTMASIVLEPVKAKKTEKKRKKQSSTKVRRDAVLKAFNTGEIITTDLLLKRLNLTPTKELHNTAAVHLSRMVTDKQAKKSDAKGVYVRL